MSSIRVPVLCAFGVGCVSSAALFGFWRADNHADTQSSKRAQSVEVVTAPKVDRPAEVVDDSARIVARAEPTRVDAVERDGDAKSEPAPAKDAQDVSNASPPPGGSAVSDVLMDLEAAYRQRLIAAARAEAAAREEASAALDRTTPAAPAEPAREVVKAVAPIAVPAVAPAPVAVAATPAPVEPAPPAAPAVVAQNDTRPIDVHIGDVNRNTYVTNVRQGDVYVIQQQLAMLNYMQLAGAAANPYAVQPPHVARGVVQHQPQQQFRQFPSTLTNLDNPWGFNFAPPNLVH